MKIWRETAVITILEKTHGGQIARFTSALADPAGRVLCGGMRAGTRQGTIYRLDRDGSMAAVLEGASSPNGMGFTPDQTRAVLRELAPAGDLASRLRRRDGRTRQAATLRHFSGIPRHPQRDRRRREGLRLERGPWGGLCRAVFPRGKGGAEGLLPRRTDHRHCRGRRGRQGPVRDHRRRRRHEGERAGGGGALPVRPGVRGTWGHFSRVEIPRE